MSVLNLHPLFMCVILRGNKSRSREWPIAIKSGFVCRISDLQSLLPAICLNPHTFRCHSLSHRCVREIATWLLSLSNKYDLIPSWCFEYLWVGWVRVESQLWHTKEFVLKTMPQIGNSCVQMHWPECCSSAGATCSQSICRNTAHLLKLTLLNEMYSITFVYKYN